MAFTLYYLLPSKMVDKSGADIINLAKAIGRTPGSVALKAWNIAAYDANRVARGRVGMTHGSRLDAFRDKAFDKGLMTLSKNCEVILSPKLVLDDITSEWLFEYEGQRIAMPSTMPPSPVFIEYHQGIDCRRKLCHIVGIREEPDERCVHIRRDEVQLVSKHRCLWDDYLWIYLCWRKRADWHDLLSSSGCEPAMGARYRARGYLRMAFRAIN